MVQLARPSCSTQAQVGERIARDEFTTGANLMQRTTVILALALSACVGAAWAQADGYPSRPIRLVVGFAPGGAADYVARAMSEAFGRALGQPVVVENKPGAGSSIAADLVAKAPP